MPENKVTVVARSTAGTAVELAVRLSQAMARSTISAGRYIQSLRLECAMRLLRRRAFLKAGQPVSEIAYASGFRDDRYFAWAFRSRFGYPPVRAGAQDKDDRSEHI
jgi:AraC-like DNA-binding protein